MNFSSFPPLYSLSIYNTTLHFCYFLVFPNCHYVYKLSIFFYILNFFLFSPNATLNFFSHFLVYLISFCVLAKHASTDTHVLTVLTTQQHANASTNIHVFTITNNTTTRKVTYWRTVITAH